MQIKQTKIQTIIAYLFGIFVVGSLFANIWKFTEAGNKPFSHFYVMMACCCFIPIFAFISMHFIAKKVPTAPQNTILDILEVLLLMGIAGAVFRQIIIKGSLLAQAKLPEGVEEYADSLHQLLYYLLGYVARGLLFIFGNRTQILSALTAVLLCWGIIFLYGTVRKLSGRVAGIIMLLCLCAVCFVGRGELSFDLKNAWVLFHYSCSIYGLVSLWEAEKHRLIYGVILGLYISILIWSEPAFIFLLLIAMLVHILNKDKAVNVLALGCSFAVGIMIQIAVAWAFYASSLAKVFDTFLKAYSINPGMGIRNLLSGNNTVILCLAVCLFGICFYITQKKASGFILYGTLGIGIFVMTAIHLLDMEKTVPLIILLAASICGDTIQGIWIKKDPEEENDKGEELVATETDGVKLKAGDMIMVFPQKKPKEAPEYALTDVVMEYDLQVSDEDDFDY